MTFVKFMRWSLDTCQLAFDLKTLLPHLLFSVLVLFFQCQSFSVSCSGLAALRRTEIKDDSILIFRFVNKTTPSKVTPANPASLDHSNVTLRIDNSFYKGLKIFFVDEISSRFTG